MSLLEVLIFLKPLFVASLTISCIFVALYVWGTFLDGTKTRISWVFAAFLVIIVSAQLMNISWSLDRVSDFKEGRESRTPGVLMEYIDGNCTCERD